MAKITKQDVEHVAKLARLGLTDKEIENYQKDLASILQYVGQLQEVDTQRARPTWGVGSPKSVTRPDEPRKSDVSPEEFLKKAPARQGRYFKVKAVLEEAS